MDLPAAAAADSWWRDAVIYEVYIRSFADGDGDGVGDIAGLRSRLGYLADLGVDAIWITPWYPSPMRDGGYDITDHCDIDPLFGTLADAAGLVRDAHRIGIRVVLDLVANHTSDRHPWFVAALAAGPGSAERDRYFFRNGRGFGGAEPPNDWISAFGGSAWTRVTESDGSPGQWYLHLFAPEQPDVNWAHEQVGAAFDGVLRFWFDLGFDGFRIDAAPAMAKVPELPDVGHPAGASFDTADWVDNPHWDIDAVHDILRRFRKIADGYDDRMLVTEAVVNGSKRLSRYVRADEMHTSFNFDYLRAPWDAAALRGVIDATLSALGAVGAPATWVLSTHDDSRHLTRYSRVGPGAPADLDVGTRRARAALLLTLALPGGAYLYQGEELGLPDVEDLPRDVLQDPTWERSGHTVRGRDACRVPLPWSRTGPGLGFSAVGVGPWLPQPERWSELSVQAQLVRPDSMLSLYRAALAIRRAEPDLRRPGLTWLDSPDNVLIFDRGRRIRCVVNLSAQPHPLPRNARPLVASGHLAGDELAPDTAVWLARA